MSLTSAEFEILKKGPRFIMNDPQRVMVRKTDELERTYEKIRSRNAEQGWILPLDRLDAFIKTIDIELTQIHNNSVPSGDLRGCYFLEKKLERSNTILRKTDKSKVFHLGEKRDYDEKVKQYMAKTDAYESLGEKNPLQDLILQTNSMLKGLLSGKHIDSQLYKKIASQYRRSRISTSVFFA